MLITLVEIIDNNSYNIIIRKLITISISGGSMKIKFNLNKENIIQFHCSNLVNTKQFKTGRILAFIYMALLFTFVCIVTERNDMRIFSIILGVILCLFFKLWFKISTRILLNKIYKKSEYSYMFDENILSINEENILIKNSLGDRVILFKSIKTLNLVDGYIFIVLVNNEYLLIPISAFYDTEEKEEFIKLIEEKSNLTFKKSYPDNLKVV